MKPLIIIGPSGVGKGTIIKQLKNKYPHAFQLVLSYTTRKTRKGEIHGLDYNFISSEQFDRKINQNLMLQHKIVFGNKYGTSKTSLLNILKNNQIPILDVDVEGMLDIRNSISKHTALENNQIQNPQTLCILPPSYKVLRQRLTHRNTQTKQVIQKRMNQNVTQIQKMLKIQDIKFVTNFQYQLTVYGIQKWLAINYQIFRKIQQTKQKQK